STPDLPRPCDPGLHIKPGVVMRLVQRHLRWQRWPRSDKGHLPPEYVDELRQLIEARSPQPAPEASGAWIIAHFEQAWVTINASSEQLVSTSFRSVNHGAELDNPEAAAALPYALLREEYRPRRLQLDDRCEHRQQRA